jgi:hypothetical protein
VGEPTVESGGVAAIIFLMPVTISFTVRKDRTSSSGMEILKAFSSSKSKVKTSSESMPRSCKFVSSVILSAGIRFTDASVVITFSATASDVKFSPKVQLDLKIPSTRRPASSQIYPETALNGL